MNFFIFIRSFGKTLFLMLFFISTSHAIALYSTLTETLYMDCIQHSSGTGPIYRADLKLTNTSKTIQQNNKVTTPQVLIPIKLVEMSHTDLCQLGVDPIFDNTGSNIFVNIPQFDIVDNSGNSLGAMNAQLLAGSNMQFAIVALNNLNQTQLITESRPKVSVIDMKPVVVHGSGSSQLRVCLKINPTISPEDNIEVNVHIALSMGSSIPANILSTPLVLINDSSKTVSSETTTIFNYGSYTAVPVFSDIPQLGYLFKHDQGASSKKNLIIMVTAQPISCTEN
jgi:type II secretory pathway component GspD/PulD (secretin)